MKGYFGGYLSWKTGWKPKFYSICGFTSDTVCSSKECFFEKNVCWWIKKQVFSLTTRNNVINIIVIAVKKFTWWHCFNWNKRTGLLLNITYSGAPLGYFFGPLSSILWIYLSRWKVGQNLPMSLSCRQELDLLPRMLHKGTLSPALSRQNRRGEWKRARQRGEVR